MADSGKQAEGVVEEVMSLIEEFYFSDGDDSSGEAIFNAFAEKHRALFSSDCDEGEQKLEWTPIFNEFVKLFESKIEGKYFSLKTGNQELLINPDTLWNNFLML